MVNVLMCSDNATTFRVSGIQGTVAIIYAGVNRTEKFINLNPIGDVVSTATNNCSNF